MVHKLRAFAHALPPHFLQTLRESLRGSPVAPILPDQTVIIQSPYAPGLDGHPVPTGAAAGGGASSHEGSAPSMGSMGSMDSAGGTAGSRAASPAHPLVEAARGLMARSAQAVEFADLDVAGTVANVMAQVHMCVL